MMGLNMTNYKMIYKDKVYNCIALMQSVDCASGKPIITNLEVTYINEDNRLEIISDKAEMFQFFSK